MDCIELINNTVLNEIKTSQKFITLEVSFFITLVVILTTLVVSISGTPARRRRAIGVPYLRKFGNPSI